MHTIRLLDKEYEYIRQKAFQDHKSANDIVADLIAYKELHQIVKNPKIKSTYFNEAIGSPENRGKIFKKRGELDPKDYE